MRANPQRDSTSLLLAERLRPVRLDDIAGNPRARSELRQWASTWAKSRTPPPLRAVLLSGPPGVGKTSAALAVAREFGWTVVEMNASDARNETAIELVAGRASLSHTLGDSGTYRTSQEGGRTLILLDEADCLTGRLSGEARQKASPMSFREFLRGRYQTVEAVAQAWGLGTTRTGRSFAKWDDVPQTPGRAAWARLASAQRDINEWRSVDRSRDLTDRGGLAAITALVSHTRQPLVLTVNDEQPLTRYSPIFRTGTARIRWYRVREEELKELLQRVVRGEGIALGEEALGAIVRRSHGDVRAALNDLDAIAPLPAGPAQAVVLAGRDLTSDFYNLTGDVLSHPRWYRSVEIRDRLDATPEDLLPWIEENLPRFAHDARNLSDAFDVLTIAERFLAWARRQRVYSLWSYSSELMTGGTSLMLDNSPQADEPPVAFPQFLGQMGRSRVARSVRKSLLQKLNRRFHVSRQKGNEAVLPLLQRVFGESPRRADATRWQSLRVEIARELELTSDEVALLMNIEPDSAGVRRILEAEVTPVVATQRRKTASSEGGTSLPTRKPEGVGKPPPAGSKAPKKVQKRLVEF